MRTTALAAIAVTLTFLAGCQTTQVTTPREYLDEQSAATITIVAKPWIFTSDAPAVSLYERNALNVYAIDVNRQGEHKQYLAVLETPGIHTFMPKEAVRELQLISTERTFKFSPVTQSPRDLGIAQPLADPLAQSFRWSYFPVSKDQVAEMAKATGVRSALLTEKDRFEYVEFANGREELAEFGAVLR